MQNSAVPLQMSASNWGTLMFLAFIWGGSFFFNGIAVQELPTLTIVALRVTLAAVFLWIYVIAIGLRIPTSLGVWAALAVMGVINNAIPFTFIVYAQTSISSGLASILNATTPLFTILVAGTLLTDERFSLRKIIGVVIGFGGVFVMMGTSAFHGQSDTIIAQCASLVAAVSYGFAATFGRRFARMGVHPILVATGQVTWSSLILWPIAFWIDAPLSLPMPSMSVWWALIGLALVSTSLAYVLYFKLLQSSGATNLSMVTFLVPVSAIILGILFLGEHLTAPQLIGMGLIGLGLLVIDGRIIRR